MSIVFYKFKAAKDFDQAVFDGLGISVFDLKKEIMVKKKLGKGLDFDLLVFNAQTNDEYPDDNQVIPRNTSILVVRRPAAKQGRGTASRYVMGGMGPAVVAPISSSSTTAADTGKPDMTEEERMEAMFKNQEDSISRQQDEMVANRPQQGFGNRGGFGTRGGHNAGTGSFRGAHRGGMEGGSGTYHGIVTYMNRPLPPGYVCFRCGKQGHHIAQCPTIGDVNYDRPKLKKTTGIPQMFLKVVDEKESGLGTANGPDGGLMVSQEGKIVVATTNDAAWNKIASSARSFGGLGDVHKMAPVLPEFKCGICLKNMKAAVNVTCCNAQFCDECIREHILDGTPQFQCFACKKELFLEGITANTTLRAAIDKHIKSFISSNGRSPNLSEATTATSQNQSPSLQQQANKIRVLDSGNGGVSAIPVLTSDNVNAGAAMNQWTVEEDLTVAGRGGYNNMYNNNMMYGNQMYGNNMMGGGGGGGGMMGNNPMWMQNNMNQMNMMGNGVGYGGGGGYNNYGMNNNGGGGGYGGYDANGKRKRDDDDEKPPGA
ncbi:DWNN-domain-containing protein [Rhizoclosmatium globosum]|uniref:DWNN-domain-containing protein n=1 Tax=Rhizoclosmatium globosum TaxID=329046 RepID=A0A1Y2BM10_9FUNG|nr:DWNN-domain-containing protein [Rhizoclosmatium globosum]|eukprot:ORY35195.1 DWNN-domain-containing protein [Rhizoclosmatium globosum]